MAQNIKLGDIDLQLPSFDSKKIWGLLPLIIIILLALGSYASKKATIEKDLDNELLLESKKIVASISSHGSEVVIYLNLIINDFK